MLEPGPVSAPVNAPVSALRRLPAGTRVVVRYRIDGGLTDALGELTALGAEQCTVSTRLGNVVIRLDDVTAAKAVPPRAVRPLRH